MDHGGCYTGRIRFGSPPKLEADCPAPNLHSPVPSGTNIWWRVPRTPTRNSLHSARLLCVLRCTRAGTTALRLPTSLGSSHLPHFSV